MEAMGKSGKGAKSRDIGRRGTPNAGNLVPHDTPTSELQHFLRPQSDTTSGHVYTCRRALLGSKLDKRSLLTSHSNSDASPYEPGCGRLAGMPTLLSISERHGRCKAVCGYFVDCPGLWHCGLLPRDSCLKQGDLT